MTHQQQPMRCDALPLGSARQCVASSTLQRLIFHSAGSCDSHNPIGLQYKEHDAIKARSPPGATAGAITSPCFLGASQVWRSNTHIAPRCRRYSAARAAMPGSRVAQPAKQSHKHGTNYAAVLIVHAFVLIHGTRKALVHGVTIHARLMQGRCGVGRAVVDARVAGSAFFPAFHASFQHYFWSIPGILQAPCIFR